MTPGGSSSGGASAIARRAALAVTLIAYAALAYGYAVLTPVWLNPDEPAHFNYVAFVARTGGLPELRQGDWDSALLERLKTGTLQPGDDVGSIRYESWQPPLFYVLAAPVYLLGDSADSHGTLLRLRIFDAVLGGLTLLVAYVVARAALPKPMALAVPITLVGIPMFTAVSAGLSADPLANLLAAVLILVCVHRLRQPARRDIRWAAGTGVLIGLGLLTKLALGIFLPLAALVVLLRSRRPVLDGPVLRGTLPTGSLSASTDQYSSRSTDQSSSAVLDSLVLVGTAAVTALPWFVHQLTTYGWADPFALARHSVVVTDQPRFPGLTLDYTVQFLTISFHSFWAQFGWMAIVAPERLYWIWGIATLVGVVGLASELPAMRANPIWQLLLGTVGVAFLAYLGYNATFQQPQGRYLFTALVPIAVLLVTGWSAWLPARLKAPVALGIATLLVALNAYALIRVLIPGFAPKG